MRDELRGPRPGCFPRGLLLRELDCVHAQQGVLLHQPLAGEHIPLLQKSVESDADGDANGLRLPVTGSLGNGRPWSSPRRADGAGHRQVDVAVGVETEEVIGAYLVLVLARVADQLWHHRVDVQVEAVVVYLAVGTEEVLRR